MHFHNNRLSHNDLQWLSGFLLTGREKYPTQTPDSLVNIYCYDYSDSRGWRHYVFGLYVRPILVNAISPAHHDGNSSNMAHMSTWTQR